jgi:hypothetical protein
MRKSGFIGWKGICSNAGKFVPADEGFAYVCDQVGITAFDYNAPEATVFVASTVEWYFSGNWIEVYKEDENGW